MTAKLLRPPEEIQDSGVLGALNQSRFWIRMKWDYTDPYQLHIRLLRHAELLERFASLKRRKAR